METAREYASKWGHVVVLKGAFTVVAQPEGPCRIAPFANPLLSVGGTGDVLAGIIGGLLAQGMTPDEAAACGVYLHGAAAETLRSTHGDRGATAGDIINAYPELPAPSWRQQPFSDRREYPYPQFRPHPIPSTLLRPVRLVQQVYHVAHPHVGPRLTAARFQLKSASGIGCRHYLGPRSQHRRHLRVQQPP